LVLLCSSVCAIAQSRSVSGCVRDRNGDSIANASVSLSSSGRTIATTATDSAGFFSFENIQSSVDHIRVTAPGFTEQSVSINQGLTDVVLAPLPISELVTVTAAGSKLGETPQSVLVLSQRALSSDPAPTLDEKLKQVPVSRCFAVRAAGPRTQRRREYRFEEPADPVRVVQLFLSMVSR